MISKSFQRANSLKMKNKGLLNKEKKYYKMKKNPSVQLVLRTT